jgi:hypothetical protein
MASQYTKKFSSGLLGVGYKPGHKIICFSTKYWATPTVYEAGGREIHRILKG